jgi:hypothetical protein
MTAAVFLARNGRTPESRTRRTRLVEPEACALADQVALELRDRREHAQD